MNYTEQHYQIALTQLVGFGPKRTKQLIQSINEYEKIFNLSPTKLAKVAGLSVDIVKKLNRDEALKIAMSIFEDISKNDIQTIFYLHPDYPRRLKQCDDAPLLIYKKGDIDLNNSKFVAIVGTRDATEYGKRLVDELISNFIGMNIVVVSGMAYGIDIATHKACVSKNVATIGVMAHGLEMVYPRLHRSTASKMIDRGCLISEYPPFTNPDRENFPMRNRIVAGMCDATIVVESKLKGGSLITAYLANDYNRDVFAFPGNVFDLNSEGCNQLIANDKAHLLRNGAEFLQKMGWDKLPASTVQKSIFPELNKDEQLIVNLLCEHKSYNIDELSIELKLPISQISVLLFQLEMSGVVKLVPGNKCALT